MISKQIAISGGLARKRAALLLGCAVFAAPSVAVAQDDGEGADAAAAETNVILVTAQRKEQDLQKVPLNVAVASAETLTATGAGDPKALENLVPGLRQPAKAAGGAGTPFLRGIGFGSTTPGLESPVAAYVDDVYTGDVTAASSGFNNVAQVEVLKGPQGTLFGRNAVAGVIHIRTKDPEYTPMLDMSVGYGNYNTISAAGYATAGLAHNVAANIAVNYRQQFDGLGVNVTTGEEIRKFWDVGVRGKLLFEIGDDASLLLTGWYGDGENDLNAYRGGDNNRNDSRNSANDDGEDGGRNVPDTSGAGTPGPYVIPANVGWYDNVNDWAQNSSSESLGASAKLQFNAGEIRVVNVAAFTRAKPSWTMDQDFSPVPHRNLATSWQTDSYSNELQLYSPSEWPVEVQLGLYYLNQKTNHTAILTGSNYPIGDNKTGVLKATAVAPFINVTVPLGSDTNLILGGRYNRDTRSLSVDVGNVDLSIPFYSLNDRNTYDELTYRVSLDHQFTPDLMGYVSYNRGYKAGTFNLNPSSPLEQPIDPEFLDAFEAGFKGVFFDGVLRLNGSAFYYDYSNVTIRTFFPGGGPPIYDNAASAEIYGVDFDFSAEVTPTLTLSGGAAYTHAQFEDYPGGINFVANTTVGGQAVGSPPVLNYAGNTMPNAPEFSGNLNAKWDIVSDPGFGDVSLFTNVAYTSKIYFEADNRLNQPAYALVNSSITWTAPDGGYGVTLYANNLTDYEYTTEAASFPTSDILVPAMPRTYGIRLNVKFGG